jgi:putative FmdB family regulatory protein
MPVYEYRCRTCDERFELQRPMSDSSGTAPCPEGHLDTVRVLSMFMTTAGARQTIDSGGGCCGGSCGCAH